MKIGDYDPVECLREEVRRFKDTNTFTPMLVTGFYLQAAIVLDEHKELTESNRQLREELEKLKARNLINAIKRICERCGHNTTEDGCPHCLQTALAAAKEALEGITAHSHLDIHSCACGFAVERALARIAECEKGT